MAVNHLKLRDYVARLLIISALCLSSAYSKAMSPNINYKKIYDILDRAVLHDAEDQENHILMKEFVTSILDDLDKSLYADNKSMEKLLKKAEGNNRRIIESELMYLGLMDNYIQYEIDTINLFIELGVNDIHKLHYQILQHLNTGEESFKEITTRTQNGIMKLCKKQKELYEKQVNVGRRGNVH
jgi:hypothetical protein